MSVEPEQASGPLEPKLDAVAINNFLQFWGISEPSEENRGGLISENSHIAGNKINKYIQYLDCSVTNHFLLKLPSLDNSGSDRRKVFLLQRKVGKVGSGLGKTTGLINLN